MTRSILLDGTHYRVAEPTGVELYVDSLFPLLCAELLSKGVKPVVAGHRPFAPGKLPEGTEWIYSPHQVWWGQRVVPTLIEEHGCKGYFTPSGMVPVKHAVPQAMSVHDLSVFSYPGAYRWGQRVRMQYMGAYIGRAAKVICTPSEYTKSQVIRHWGLKESSITVTPLALPVEPDQNELPSLEISSSLTKLDLHRPILLYVGRIEAKKNLDTLINAFALLWKQYESAEPHLRPQLVLAGSNGHGYEGVRKELSTLRGHGRDSVFLPGYIDAVQKRFLFAKASVCVVPGGHEGFGLGILEGFAHGVPVVGAGAGAVPEVLDGAGLQVVPYTDSAAWANALAAALSDERLREHWKSEGKRRLETYTWERTARITASALTGMLS